MSSSREISDSIPREPRLGFRELGFKFSVNLPGVFQPFCRSWPKQGLDSPRLLIASWPMDLFWCFLVDRDESRRKVWSCQPPFPLQYVSNSSAQLPRLFCSQNCVRDKLSRLNETFYLVFVILKKKSAPHRMVHLIFHLDVYELLLLLFLLLLLLLLVRPAVFCRMKTRKKKRPFSREVVLQLLSPRGYCWP